MSLYFDDKERNVPVEDQFRKFAFTGKLRVGNPQKKTGPSRVHLSVKREGKKKYFTTVQPWRGKQEKEGVCKCRTPPKKHLGWKTIFTTGERKDLPAMGKSPGKGDLTSEANLPSCDSPRERGKGRSSEILKVFHGLKNKKRRGREKLFEVVGGGPIGHRRRRLRSYAWEHSERRGPDKSRLGWGGLG